MTDAYNTRAIYESMTDEQKILAATLVGDVLIHNRSGKSPVKLRERDLETFNSLTEIQRRFVYGTVGRALIEGV